MPHSGSVRTRILPDGRLSARHLRSAIARPLWACVQGSLMSLGGETDEGHRRRMQMAKENRPRLGRPVALATDGLVLRFPGGDPPLRLVPWHVGRYPTVQLMKRTLAEQHHQIGSRPLAGTAVEIQIHHSAAGQVEGRIVATQGVEPAAAQKHRIALGHGHETAVFGGSGGCPDFKQSIAIAAPVDPGQQSIFAFLVIALADRQLLRFRPQMPGGQVTTGSA